MEVHKYARFAFLNVNLIYGGALFAYISVYYLNIWYVRGPEEFPGTGDTDG